MSRSDVIPDGIQWHEGMLLAPQHFQLAALRSEQLVHYHAAVTAPFHWGVVRLGIDQGLLVDGTLRINELEAVMPDRLVVTKAAGEGPDLELQLTPHTDAIRQSPATVHLAVPALRLGSQVATGQLARYESIDGAEVVDTNTGDNPVPVPRLRPRLQLLLMDDPPEKYVTFPLAQVTFRDEKFALTKFVAPTIVVSLGTPLDQLATRLAKRVREKALFLSDRVRSSSATMKRPIVLQMQAAVHSLAAPLPYLEAVLNTRRAHPFDLYLALCQVVGHVASLTRGLVPPNLGAYNHNDLGATFERLNRFINQTLDGIQETYYPVPFELGDQGFTLKLEREWVGDRLIVGALRPTGMTEADVLNWLEDSLIGSATKMVSIHDRRIRGAARRPLDVSAESDLVPSQGMVVFSVTRDPEFIEPDQPLVIWHPTPAGRERRPEEIVLYVETKSSG